MLSTARLSGITKLFLVALSLSAFVACKKDKKDGPDTPPPPPASTKLKEFKNGDEFIRLTYNGDGSIQKVDLNSELTTDNVPITYTVVYNAAKKIESLETTIGHRVVAVYANGVMTRADMFNDGEKVGYTAYAYENGRIKSATIYVGETPDFLPMLSFHFEYDANGNPSENVAMMNQCIPNRLDRAGHVTYQYDQKTNPLYQHNDLLALFWQIAGKNNPVLENHFDAQLQPEDRFEYTYKYKSNGLPESAVVKEGLVGQPQTTSNIFYSYQ